MVVLAKDEEEGVHEFYEFGEVVPPEDTDDLQAKGLWFFSSAFLECHLEHAIHMYTQHKKLESPAGSQCLRVSELRSLWVPLINEHAILGGLEGQQGCLPRAPDTLAHSKKNRKRTPALLGFGGRSQRIQSSGSSLAT